MRAVSQSLAVRHNYVMYHAIPLQRNVSRKLACTSLQYHVTNSENNFNTISRNPSSSNLSFSWRLRSPRAYLLRPAANQRHRWRELDEWLLQKEKLVTARSLVTEKCFFFSKFLPGLTAKIFVGTDRSSGYKKQEICENKKWNNLQRTLSTDLLLLISLTKLRRWPIWCHVGFLDATKDWCIVEDVETFYGRNYLSWLEDSRIITTLWSDLSNNIRTKILPVETYTLS